MLTKFRTANSWLRSSLFLRGVLALCWIGIFSVANAQATDATWALFQTHLQANKGLVAHEIVSRFEVPGDNGRISGAYKTSIQRWDASGEPVRGLAEQSEDGRAGLRIAPLSCSIADKLADHPEELFQSLESLIYLGDQELQGTVWSVMQSRSRLPRGNAQVHAKVWLNPRTGQPNKVEGVIEQVPMPGVKSINFTLKYAADAEGRSLPLDVTVHSTIALFFHSGSVSFTQELGKWRRRSQYDAG